MHLRLPNIRFKQCSGYGFRRANRYMPTRRPLAPDMAKDLTIKATNLMPVLAYTRRPIPFFTSLNYAIRWRLKTRLKFL